MYLNLFVIAMFSFYSFVLNANEKPNIIFRGVDFSKVYMSLYSQTAVLPVQYYWHLEYTENLESSIQENTSLFTDFIEKEGYLVVKSRMSHWALNFSFQKISLPKIKPFCKMAFDARGEYEVYDCIHEVG